jgi:hypothetical protein
MGLDLPLRFLAALIVSSDDKFSNKKLLLF